MSDEPANPLRIEINPVRPALPSEVNSGFGQEEDYVSSGYLDRRRNESLRSDPTAGMLREQGIDPGLVLEGRPSYDRVEEEIYRDGEGALRRRLIAYPIGQFDATGEVMSDTVLDRDDIAEGKREVYRLDDYDFEPVGGRIPGEQADTLFERIRDAVSSIGAQIVEETVENPGDVVTGIVAGLDEGAQNVLQALRLDGAYNAIEEMLYGGTADEATRNADLPQAETMAGQVVGGFAEYAPQLAVGGMAVAPVKVAIPVMGWLKGMGAGFIADMLGDPEDETLGDLAAQLDAFDNQTAEAVRQAFIESLSTDADDGEFERRLKQAGGGVIAGAVFDGLIASYRAMKAVAKKSPEIMDDAFGRFGLQLSSVDPATARRRARSGGQAPANPRQTNTANGVGLRADGTANESAVEELQRRATDDPNTRGRRIKIDHLATYFDEQHVSRHGRKLDPTNSQDFALGVRQAAEEIHYQLGQAISGRGWYDYDIELTFQRMSQIPGLEAIAYDENLRVLWSALAGATSNGNKVFQNAKIATAMLLDIVQNGNWVTSPPPAGGSIYGVPGTGWGAKGPSIGAGVRFVKHMWEKLGPDGFSDWWMSVHTLREITDARIESGLKGAPGGLRGGLNSLWLGARALGDKTGQFSLNINGYAGTTKDVWFTRGYRRIFGEMYNKNTGEVQGQPQNGAERDLMEDFVRAVVREVQNTYGERLTEQDVQAVMWYFEQNLYTDLGVPSMPRAFSEGVESVQQQIGSGVRTGTGGEAELPALEEWRAFSEKQRNVRAQRRGILVSRSGDGVGAEKPPGPYTRETEGADGSDGLLTLSPDPEVKRRFESVGIKLPVVREIPIEDAETYSADMAASVSVHPQGVQVDIKSPADLRELKARLFRTETGGGFAVTETGDIIAVFAAPGETGAGYSLISAAVQAGGRKLDAYDTYLPHLYAAAGFKPVARMKWNEDFIKEGWDKQVFSDYNKGEPDIVFMVYDPDYYGPPSGGLYFDDYEAAVAAQDAEMQRLHGND